MNQDKRKTVPPNITHLMCYLVFTYNFLPTVASYHRCLPFLLAFTYSYALEYVHMRGEINSNRYEISFWLKIAPRCSVSSLLLFTWIEAKWNSKRYGFHIGHFHRNEISNWHEIFMWAQTRWMLRLMRMCVWNSRRVWISYRPLWQKLNFIIMQTLPEMECLHMSIKILGPFEMQPKWNFMWTELVFTLVWSLKPVWVYVASHVNVLLHLQFYCTFTWDPKWTQTSLRFHFGVKFHFGVRQLHYQRSHDFRRSETLFGANFTSVKLTEE